MRSSGADDVMPPVEATADVDVATSQSDQLGGDGFVMDLVSDGLPTTVSSGQVIAGHWFPDSDQGAITFDLSSLTVAQRTHLLVSTEFPATELQYPLDFEPPAPLKRAASSYVIETNTAVGGAVPASGWATAVSVDPNRVRARQDVIDARSANWLRLTVFGSDDPTFDMRVNLFSTDAVPTDDWLFVGDSITVRLIPGRLSSEVAALAPGRDMDSVNVAIGGTGSDDAVDELSRSLPRFPGQFVVLAYGTNDVGGTYDIDAAIEMVIAAGKTPVIPLVPWALTPSTDGIVGINAQIDALFDVYPELVAGPDLYAAFFERPELFNDQIHPNDGPGVDALHSAWAEMIAGALPPPTTVVDPPDGDAAIDGAARLEAPMPAVRGT